MARAILNLDHKVHLVPANRKVVRVASAKDETPLTLADPTTLKSELVKTADLTDLVFVLKAPARVSK